MKKEECQKIGDTLRQLREREGISQAMLGERLGGVDEKQISRYERGEAQMGAVLYDKWLSYFGQKVNDPQTMELLQIFATLTSNEKEILISMVKGVSKKTS